MKTQQKTSVQCVSKDQASRSESDLMSNVYASRRGRSPKEPKGMANADVVMARLESGLPLKDALIPGASYEGWHSHCKLFPEWAAKAKALVARNAEAGKARKLEKMGVLRRRNMTHCARGHEFTAENTRHRRYNGYNQRQCKECERLRQMETGPLLKPEKIAALVDAMKRDRNFAAIKRICPDTLALYRTVRKVPEFGAVHHDWASGGRARAVKAYKRTRTQRRYNEVMGVLPARMLMATKIEIISMIYEAHALRRFRGKPFGITKAKSRVKEFIAEYYKQNPTKAYGGLDSPWSLDAPVGYDNKTPLVETIGGDQSLWS